MPISVRFKRHFAPKKPVNNTEVHDSQQDAEAPPDQTNVQRVWPGLSKCDSDVASLCPHSGEYDRKESGCCAGEHRSKVYGGTEEGSEHSPLSIRKPSREQTCYNNHRDKKSNRVLEVVVQ